jgi:hypothetical protein
MLVNQRIYPCNDRHCSCVGHAGDNTADDFGHDISLALPLDSCCCVHCLIIDCGMHIYF